MTFNKNMTSHGNFMLLQNPMWPQGRNGNLVECIQKVVKIEFTGGSQSILDVCYSFWQVILFSFILLQNPTSLFHQPSVF